MKKSRKVAIFFKKRGSEVTTNLEVVMYIERLFLEPNLFVEYETVIFSNN